MIGSSTDYAAALPRMTINRAQLLCGIYLLVCLCLSCRPITERLDAEQVVNDITAIRNAQMEHRQISGRYGSVEELVGKGLLEARFRDGRESGHAFELAPNGDRYILSVAPLDRDQQVSSGLTSVETFYLDETGIIRVSYDPKKPADSEGLPLQTD